MMTAIEANLMAITHNKEIMENNVKEIENEIQKAAMKGIFSVRIPLKNDTHDLIYSIGNYLCNLGYNVDIAPSTQYDSAELRISWEDANIMEE